MTEQVIHPPEWPIYGPAAQHRVVELVRDSKTFDYGYGPEIAALESDFASMHGRRFALALSSGTAALFATFSALGLGPGDEVIVPDYTFFSTATPLFLLGAIPVLADVSEPEGNIDPRAAEDLVGPGTAAIVVTHLWGHPADLGSLRAIACRHGLALVEDCSHAHGSTLDGGPVGRSGDIAIFSIGGHKAVSGGMGGILLTDSEDLYSRACLLATFRHRTDLTIRLPDYHPLLPTGLGGNFRITPIAAVLAHSHLLDLDTRVAARIRNMTRLIGSITQLKGIKAVPIRDGCTMGAWYDGVVEVTEDCAFSRDELADRLKRDGLAVRAPATRPLHTYPLFQGAVPAWSDLLSKAVAASAKRNAREFPRSQRVFDHWLRLPVNFLWDDEGMIVEPYAKAFARVLEFLSSAPGVMREEAARTLTFPAT